MKKNSSALKKKIVAKPSPEDVISVRYCFPGRLVAKTELGVEIRTCVGGTICVPQSLVTVTEQIPAGRQSAATARPWNGEGTHFVVLEGKVRRDLGGFVTSMIAEIARLTIEVQKHV